MSQKSNKPIEVYNKEGKKISHCTKKRAAQMVQREKAMWIGFNQVMLLIDRQEEKEIRQKVLLRDNYTCYYCDTKLLHNEATIDHLTPRSRGGADHPDNLVCSCHDCNEDKGSLTLEEYYLYLTVEVLRNMSYYNQGGYYETK